MASSACAGGRVMDPESRLDGIRWVAIDSGRITAVSEEQIGGRVVVDVSGLVVSPAAGRLGTSLPIGHLGSSANREISAALSLIDGARAEGVDVTTELYPYTAASTVIESAIFEPGWQEKLSISYGDLEWAATGERLTEESFARHRMAGGWVIIHMMSEDVVTTGLSHPEVSWRATGCRSWAGAPTPGVPAPARACWAATCASGAR